MAYDYNMERQEISDFNAEQLEIGADIWADFFKDDPDDMDRYIPEHDDFAPLPDNC